MQSESSLVLQARGHRSTVSSEFRQQLQAQQAKAEAKAALPTVISSMFLCVGHEGPHGADPHNNASLCPHLSKSDTTR